MSPESRQYSRNGTRRPLHHPPRGQGRVFDYLETFYNTRRRHSALGYISPAAFEARHTLERRTAQTVSTVA